MTGLTPIAIFYSAGDISLGDALGLCRERFLGIARCQRAFRSPPNNAPDFQKTRIRAVSEAWNLSVARPREKTMPINSLYFSPSLLRPC